MLHINKVKRILRAKNGSQIPKFLNPAGPFLLSSFWANPTLNTQTPSIFGNNLSNSFASNYSNMLYNPNTLGNYNAENGSVKSSVSGLGADIGDEKSKQQTQNNSLSGKVGNFISKNLALLGMGLDYANNQLFGDLKQSSGMDTVTNLLNYTGIGGKAISFGMNALDSLGKENFNFKLNTEFASDAGASYQNLINDALRLQSKSGNYGLSSRSKLNKAKREKAKISEGIVKTTDILNTAKDQKQTGSNDLNYLKYNSIINGNNYFAKSAKLGGKLIDKISLIKSRNLVKQYINSDTLQIEEFAKGGTLDWEPTINIFEPVIEISEFLKGGLIEENWEPTIEILNDLPEYKSGGKTQQELETPEIEETTQKNIIPEGALHKNKHHIEHTEGLTKKGIPVVDNDGNLQAEVEKEEIIFSLEVTKKLEELYKDYYDSDKSLKEKDAAAIEAGKLLVYQILFNTDDRTGLIKRCEEGGKL